MSDKNKMITIWSVLASVTLILLALIGRSCEVEKDCARSPTCDVVKLRKLSKLETKEQE